jgi:predicted DsbA family dithiol-disulfide isomerase/very-short-patch-repair endonuclease
MWRDPPLEVSVPLNASRLGRHGASVVIHYDRPEIHERGDVAVVDLRDAIVHAVRSLSFEEAVSALDWALHTGRIDDSDLACIGDRLPRSVAGVVDWVDRDCESFLESIVRTRLQIAGHSVVSQERVNGSQRIDLVVAGAIAVEVDGREHHESAFESDRRKDLAITLEQKHALRLTYTLIQQEWPRVLAAIETALELRRLPFSVSRNGRYSKPRRRGGAGPWRLEKPRARSGRAGNAGRGAPVGPGVSDSMSSSSPLKVDVWSDIACPWCFIGKRKFETAAAAFGGEVEVEYHSFELSPDTPVDFEGNEAEFLAGHKGLGVDQAQSMLDNVKGIAAQVGLHYDFDAMHHTNTVKAHELIHYAKAHGVQLDVVERLLQAYFEQGRHLGRIDVLADVAAEAGLDRDDALRSLQAEEFLADVRADQAQAQAFGINGVPFFVFEGRYGVSGAQDPAVFREVLDKVAAERAEVEAEVAR